MKQVRKSDGPLLLRLIAAGALAFVALAVVGSGWAETAEATGSPASCSDILASGGSVGDGVYTIDPAQDNNPVDVFCDMTTDGGGWTLAGYGADANLGGYLSVANGAYDATARTGSANIASVALARGSLEVALAWSNGAPAGGIGSYSEAVGYAIPNPASQTLVPISGGYQCSSAQWTAVTVNTLAGSPALPSTMYTRTASLGASYGSAYGLVRSNGNPQCDWFIDGQGFRAVYLGIAAPSNRRGVVYEPGGIGNQAIPATMSIWFRGDITPPTQTLSILGGNGAAGTVDASTDWSDDVVAWNGGISTTGAWHFTGNPNPVWEPAYLVGSHPWGLVPGTNSWVNCGPTNASAECGNAAGTVVAFRVRFTIPAGSINPDITFWINSDNAGTYYINGTQVTDRLVGGGGAGANPVPPSAPGVPGVRGAALQSALQGGQNEMLVIVEDWGGLAGFNFRADLTVQGTEPPVIVPPTPVDTTPPSITVDVSGPLGDNGWYVGDVDVTWTVTDAQSIISSTSGCDATTVSTDTAALTLTCTATSAGGTASESITIKRDATAPDATATRTPAANANGWNNTDVTVAFSGTDALSGIASCDADVVLGEGAGQSASGTCTDNAGNVSAPATVGDINVDKTAPVVTIVGTTDGSSYLLGDEPTVSCSTTDALSGVDVEATAVVTGGPVGAFSVTCDGATDLAGNTASATTAAFTVTYDFCGFKQPLLAPVQTFKAGSTVPVKFCVQDASGAFVGGVVAEVYANGVLQGEAKQTDDGYHFNLRTKGMSKGPLLIEVRLDDGTTHAIEVALK